MEEIKLSPQELKEAIDFGKLIGSGFFSSVFTYKGRLIKLDKELYKLLKANDPRLSTEVIIDRYRWDKEDFNDREQLEELEKRQPFIRPKVPEGIITLKGVDSKIDGLSPGIIVPHFKGYKSLASISKSDYKRLLIILRRIFDDIKNLADNEIANEDIIAHRKTSGINILQKGDDAQIIDMSGPFVTVGKTYTGPKYMYEDFAKLLNQYYKANGLEPIYSEDEVLTEQQLAEMITEFEKEQEKNNLFFFYITFLVYLRINKYTLTLVKKLSNVIGGVIKYISVFKSFSIISVINILYSLTNFSVSTLKSSFLFLRYFKVKFAKAPTK